MKAVVYHGKYDVRVDEVPDPRIENLRDAIVKVTSTAICGSDLHLYDGYIPEMHDGDILGHEFMGEVVEVGSANKKLKPGDRVVVPFNICCGECWFCTHGQWSVCERTNRTGDNAKKLFGHVTAGLFGYSHLTGGYPGGQAQYVRVPFADVCPTKVPNGLTDEQVLFLTDIFPTGWQGADFANIQDGDTVAVWGCGPVGQFCIRSAQFQGAGHVVAVDRIPERLALAQAAGAETINFEKEDVYDRLNHITKGRGPDDCIDAVGMEAHGHGSWDAVADRALAAAGIGTDRIHALRDCLRNVRAGGTVSLSGVYGGFLNMVRWAPAGGRPVDHLLANAGRGLGRGFLDQNWDEARRVVDTNITGTIYLIHKIGNDMRRRGEGRILITGSITGSIAGFMPGSYQAVYNGTKAFLDFFSYAIREELGDSGVTVTCLMPGATETEFFERADLMDTKIGTEKKMDPAEVTRQGYEAMMKGEGQVITGWKNKMQAAMAHVMPAGQLAKQHSKETAPGTADKH